MVFFACMKIVLLSCVKSKLTHRTRAADLYTSPLFKGSVKYARSLKPDQIFILSAKYGLLDLDQVVEPYEETLNGKPVAVLRAWAEGVARQLAGKTDLANDTFVFLAGNAYRKYLIPYMSSYEVPLEGKTMGQQLSFYANLGS